MKVSDAIEMAKARLECLERNTSGIAKQCNNYCGDCGLNYAQGNAGEQKEWLRLAIKGLYMLDAYMKFKNNK